MELRQLKTFKTVAMTLSFHRAAEILHYAQSTISARIRALEDQFGIPLFDRLGNHISLTEAGQKLLYYADRLLDMEAETLAEMSDIQETQATLSIRIPQTLSTQYLPEILSRFKQHYGKVGFDISTCAFHSLQHELKTGVTDLAFLFDEDPHAPELVTEVLGYERIIMIVNRNHPFTQQKPVGLKSLTNETILLPKHDCAYKMNLERHLAEEKIASVTIMEFNSIESIKQCVLQDVGIGLIPQIMAKDEIKAGILKVLPDIYDTMSAKILMLRHRNKWLSPALKAFISETRQVFNLYAQAK